MRRLTGITWDHPRGYDPMAATGHEYSDVHPDVEIRWSRRSLQAFGDFSVETLAGEYDLVVLDHPHCGAIASAGCLLPLDETRHAAELPAIASQSVGPSFGSYFLDGHQWALPVDAASHVSAYRPDLIDQPPKGWAEVLDLARSGRVLWPAKPVDAMMSFFTIAANMGIRCCDRRELFIEEERGAAVLETMRELGELVPASCRTMNPFEALDQMARDDQYAYCPFLFGYSNYSRPDFRKRLIAFGDIPTIGNQGPVGAILGGAGIAVSSKCRHPNDAVDYAFWVAGAGCQKGLYFDSGGQPANAVAWEDPRVNAACAGFFTSTRNAIERAYVRPRYNGFLTLQEGGGRIIHSFLTGRITLDESLGALEEAHRSSYEGRRVPA